MAKKVAKKAKKAPAKKAKASGGDNKAYCVKCRKKVTMEKAKKIIMKNKKPAMKGECSLCGTKVFRIGGC